MSVTRKKILRKVGIFLTQIAWGKILTFSFFLLLSTIFWLMQVYRQSFEATLSIPIKYTSVPDSVVFKYRLPTKLDVRVKDDGAALIRYFFVKRNDSLEINVTKMLSKNTNPILQGAALEQLMRNYLFVNSKILSYSPIRISWEYSALKSKKVPVVFDGQVYLASGYLLSGEIRVIPDSVIAYASQDYLNTIEYAYTQLDTIHNFNTNTPLKFKLVNIDNVKFIPSSVLVQVPVDEFTEKQVNVQISCLNIPDNVHVKFFPSTIKVSFFVGLSKYKYVTEKDFSIEFDYNDLRQMNRMLTPVRLTSSPGYIGNIRIEPSEVEFIFEQK